MDTQSAQAPHTCSRIGNGRSNISDLGKEFSSCAPSQTGGVKDATDHAPGVCTTACFGRWRDYLLLAPGVGVMWNFPPHSVFVVPPRSDDLYYLALRIKEGVFRSDLPKPAFHKLRVSAPVAQQPCCGREAKRREKQLPCCCS